MTNPWSEHDDGSCYFGKNILTLLQINNYDYGLKKICYWYRFRHPFLPRGAGGVSVYALYILRGEPFWEKSSPRTPLKKLFWEIIG